MYRFTRVPFGVNASPFLLSATVEKHISDTNTDIAHIIKDNVYVDNVILSMDTETQALELYTEGKKIFHAANMNLREWLSNSKTVMSGIPQEDHANSTTAKILGMPWDSEADTMSFQTPEVPKQLMTKRKAVKFISSLYDPLGLLVPMTLESKLLIQSLWKLKLAWDDELPDIKKSEFHSLISNYISVSNIQIPRCAAPFGVVKSQQLHTFVDASQYAYACCSYLRTENADGSIKCTLLFAKNRLAPSNTAITIPKMETLALLIGTRAQVVLEKEMRIPLDKRIIWSDSQCVLHWLTSTHRLPVFIENRMKEIRKHSNKTSFRYVKSEENPADYATKNGNGQVLDTNSTWWNGPVWLQLDEKSWPVWKYDITHQFTTMENEVCSESEAVCPSTLQVATVRVVESTNSQFPLKIERFSSLTKLHRVTALVLRYLDRRIWSRLSKATRDSHAGLQTILRHSFTKGPVQALELKKAELILIKTIQHASYEQELAVIHFGSADTKLLKNLNIKIDNDGIMRNEGRLAHSRQIHWKTNSPILLPTHHSYTNLMIKHVHHRLLHAGVQQTLSTIRLAYWIPKGRQTVKRIIQSCVTCKRIAGGPYRYPSLPNLPKERVNFCKPFEHTGLDYMGPITYRNGKEQHKGWICLMTCFATRAVHMELLSDMSTEQFLLALRRFIARRGCPGTILTDNAPQFVKAAKVVQWEAQLLDKEVQNYCSSHGIQWQFNTPLAPWTGGVYECMIGIIKPALRKTLGRKIPQQDELFTLLTEIEAVVNCRPLTYVYSDQESTMIRPIDLITPRSQMLGTPQLTEDHDDEEYVPVWNSANKLIHHWAKSQQLLDTFWDLWKSEYLCSLRERFTRGHPNPKVTSLQSIQQGDMVVIRDDSLPRGSWRLGRVVDIQESSDRVVRSATVEQPNGSVLHRPISFLYPLEIPQKSENNFEISHSKRQEEKKKGITPPVINTYFYRALMLITLMCIPQIEAHKCTNETKLTYVRSQNCVPEGLVIMSYEKGSFCYVMKTCHKQFLLLDGKCVKSSACSTRCPRWATQCSYYAGSLSQKAETTSNVLNDLAINVCSFNKSKECSENPVHLALNQVLLYDGTKHFVTDVDTSLQNPVNEMYDCIGKGPRVGSSVFCSLHECAKRGTQFCYFRQAEIMYLHSRSGKILIKGWGTLQTQVYPEKHVPPETPICITCSISCTLGGATVTVDKMVGSIEVCSKPYCYRIPHPNTHEVIRFPPNVPMTPYEVEVKISSNGVVIKQIGKLCEPQPFCEDIDCYLCWIRIENWQCTSRFLMIIAFVFVYFSAVTIYFVMKILKIIVNGGYYGGICCYLTGKLCQRHCRKYKKTKKIPKKTTDSRKITTRVGTSSEDEQQKHHKKHEKRKVQSRARTNTSRMKKAYLTLAIIVVQLGAQARRSAAVTILQAPQSVCTTYKNGTQICVITEATRIALAPQGSDASLLIKDPTGSPLGTIQIEVDQLLLKCDPKNEYFSRSFKMKTAAVKRCWKAGSCHGNACAETKIGSKFKELSDEANNKPGFTHCAATCGCAGCGCWFCTSGCLFFRTYAEPQSQKVFEIFSCPAWKMVVSVSVRLITGNQTSSFEAELLSGIPFKRNNMVLTAIAVSKPPLPILGSTFLTDGTRTVMVKASATGQPVSGTIGELQCSTREKAQKFDCYLPHDSCQCYPQQEKVSCTCTELSIEPLFDKAEYLLPLKSEIYTLKGVGNQITAEYSQHTAVELQLTIDGMRLSSQTDSNLCYITPGRAAGCYACITGMKLEFECKTDFGESVAHVICGQGSFSATCKADGNTGTATMTFPHAEIDEICQVSCPAGNTEFNLKTTLAFIPNERIGDITNMVVGKYVPPEVDLGFLGRWLKSNWMSAILAVVVAVILVLLTICYGPVLLQFLVQSCKKRKKIETIF